MMVMNITAADLT